MHFPHINCFAFEIVKLRNDIYILGGISRISREAIMDVKCYKTDTRSWIDASPMMPITDFASVAFQDNIFVVGQMPDEEGMTAQVYSKESDSWAQFAPPEIFRHYTGMSIYHGKLYLIGGYNEEFEALKNVEVFTVFQFDISEGRWERVEDLPYDYEDSVKSIIINDKLIVFEIDETNEDYSPPVSWNDVETC